MTSVGVMASAVVSGTCVSVLREQFNDLTAWTQTSSPTIALGRTGSALQASGATARADYNIGAGGQSDTLTIGFAFRRTDALTTARDIIHLYSDAGVTLHNKLNYTPSTSTLVFTRSTTTIATATSVTFTQNTWYYIELRTVLNDTTGSVIVRINGTEVINATGLDTRNAGTKTVYDQIRLAPLVASTTQQYDDLYLTAGSGCAFQGDQVMCNEVLLEPFDNLTAWTGSGGTITTGRTNNGLRFAGAGSRTYPIPTAQQAINITFGFAYRVATLGNNTIVSVLTSGSTSTLYQLASTATGQLQGFIGGSSTLSAAGLIVANTWVYIEAKLTFGNSIGFFEARINGATAFGPTSNTDTNPGFSDGTPYGAFALSSISGVNNDFDDLYITTGGCPFKGSINL